MKVGELIEKLQKLDRDAIVYVMTDHGQLPEQINCDIAYSDDMKQDEKFPYYGDDLCWEEEMDWDNKYRIIVNAEDPKIETAILIF